MVSPPSLSGLHHVTLPVTDLDASTAWYTRVLAGERVPALDHHDAETGRYSVVLALPGVAIPVQLRLAPEAAGTAAAYDPLTLSVTDRAELDRWAAHLDTCQVPHGSVVEARMGHALSFHDPDGTMLRLYTEPVGGFDAILKGR
ncbi:VOC family protein [Streptomyces sp. NPDC056296]|uniref:VOC family protein n=1 Tax=Streptomyces sp. NPDC056296 TaxID=3345775 RepID=UPI0035DF4888